MALRESGGVASDASARHSWASGDDADRTDEQTERLALDSSRFGFRPISRSDATSQQSDAVGAFDEERFAGFQRSREASEEHDHQDDDDYDEEEQEEEEEDDDDVRHSWTTEKEVEQGRFSGAIDLTSFRFRRPQPVEGHGEEDHDDQEEEEEEAEERDSDASFASLEWVTRQLRQLERRQHGSSTEADAALQDEDTGGSMDSHVREALKLLNGGGGEEQQGEREEEWAKSAADRRGSYFDIVQEAMAVEWRRDDEYDDHRSDHEDEEVEEQDEEEAQQSEGESAAPEDAADEWLEAFTAKGRVYYYNRRTRESSWTKPENLGRSEHLVPDERHVEDYNSKQEEEEEDDDNDDRQSNGGGQPQQQQQEHDEDDQSNRRSRQSSTSSMSSSNQETDRAANTESNYAPSNVLFCCFCGVQLNGSSGFQSHFGTCATLNHHKQTASPLYTQFQQVLVLLSEDASLRSLHYASSFPDAKPHPIGLEPPAQTEQSVQESLALLRVKHRSSRKPVVHRTTPDYDNRVPLFQPVRSQASSVSASSKRLTKTPPREPLASRYSSMKQKPTPVALLNMETCRHCSRSFAEGRLAKHEAVCPRVFGNEHAWGRGPPSTSIHKKSFANEPDQSYNPQRSENMLGLLKKKHHTNLKHTLALSFQEHQASLVECPCCRRKFAPSGAQQHIDICKTVQHRPRNPVPLLKDYALAS